jgi:hypothetical protein
VALAWESSGANTYNVRFDFCNFDVCPEADNQVYVGETALSDTRPGYFVAGKTSATGLVRGDIFLNHRLADCGTVAAAFAHELGHPMGLKDCYDCTNTVMSKLKDWSDPFHMTTPSACDVAAVLKYFDAIVRFERKTTDPMILDLDGDGLDLTSSADGVDFDMNGDGAGERVAWTAAGSDDAWLVLDRNANGVIDDGTELFGNITDQPQSDSPHGFVALAVFDGAAVGGNGNDLIDAGDAVWSRLRLWTDADHNGKAESAELQPLSAAGVTALELDFKTAGRRDRHENYLRYRAKVLGERNVGRWSYDVFLQRAQ